MPSETPSLRAADVLAFLEKRQASAPAATDQEERLRSRYRQAAAVLAALRDPEKFRPVGGPGRPNEGLQLLGDELIPATGRRFEGLVMLRPESRRQAIAEMPTREQRQEALQANPDERRGALQQELESYLIGRPKTPDRIAPSDLENTLQVSLWLERVVDGVPPADKIRLRLARQNLLSPFEAIAGDAIFRGRVSEMDRLRSYVGVLPPEQLLRRMADRAFRWLQPNALPALSVSGPGGVGKSALIARFILEHSRLPEGARIPYTYLDFDRPTLNIAEPAGLVAEMLYQLDLQFPQYEEFRKLREVMTSRMGETLESPDAPPGARDDDAQVRGIMADILGLISTLLGPRPYVVVLDTFEEVQYRGETRAFPVWEVLADIQARMPFLRVVVSGRAPVSTLNLAGKPPEQLVLGDLDREAAVAFLRSRGVDDPAMAEAVVKQVGGVPLSLQLAASVLKEGDAADDKGIREFSGRSRFWFSPSDEVIQGQLYERILGRLHNPLLERLAHPGLVLRRVNPEVIFNVLNGPCQLALESLDDARKLFDELQRETSLVTSDSLDGSLVHRPDLRRMMLKLLVQKAPAQVEEIRRAAVAWYARQQGWRARAEELYHRLQLGESIQAADVKDPEIRSTLQASIVEFPVSAQTELSALGFLVSPEVLSQASQEQYERYQAAQIEELLPYGERSLRQARDQIAEAEFRGRASWLYRPAARVAAQLGDVRAALGLVEEGLHWGVLEGNTLQVLELAADKAWLLRGTNSPQPLAQTLDMLNEYGQRHSRKAAMLQHRAQLFEISAADVGRDVLLKEIAQMLPALAPYELWGVWPVFENVLSPMSQLRPEAAHSLRDIVMSEGSPFQRAQFSNRSAQRALDGFLKTISLGPEQPVFGKYAVELCRNWPYRILYVSPPYGSHGFDGSYAVAAR